MQKLLKPTFYLLLVLHLSAIFLPEYVVTQDGPSHTYNSFIIKNLLLGEENILTQAHQLNYSPEPNLSGHYLLAFFMLVFPPVFAEKLLLALYVIVFAFGFRYLLKQMNVHASFSILCFPLVFNLLFYFGFYNFILGFASSVFFFALYLNWVERPAGAKLLILALLSVFIYFSHLVAFLYCGIFSGICILSVSFRAGFDFQIFKKLFRRTLLLFLPGIMLTMNYLISQEGEPALYENFDLVHRIGQLLFHMAPANVFGYSEGTYLKMLLFTAYCLSGGVLFSFKKKQSTFNFLQTMLWLLLFSLVLYLFIPDGLSGGSVIVPRIALYFMLFLLCIAGMQTLSRFSNGLLILYAVVSIGLLIFRFQIMLHASHAAADFLEVEKQMEKGSVFYTLTAEPVVSFPNGYKPHAGISFPYHFDNYLALKNKGLSARNYEAHIDSERNYFPIRWKEGFRSGRLHQDIVSDKSTEIIDFDRYNLQNIYPIRYFITYAEPEGDYHESLMQCLPQNYSHKFTSKDGYIRLYEHIPQ